MGRRIQREREDFDELGDLLTVASEALATASTKARSMYRVDQRGGREIDAVHTALQELRHAIDDRWRSEVTTGKTDGPSPIFGPGVLERRDALLAIERITYTRTRIFASSGSTIDTAEFRSRRIPRAGTSSGDQRYP